jgi:hypothetical protein
MLPEKEAYVTIYKTGMFSDLGHGLLFGHTDSFIPLAKGPP